MHRHMILAVSVGVLATLAGRADAAIIRVSASAAPGGDGSSWAAAMNDLRSALTAAQPGDEVWVARGLYKPTTTTDRNARFVVPGGVKLLGGFAGTESLASQRPADPDPASMNTANDTVLSGEIGAPGFADNTLTVLQIADNAPATTQVDRVVVTRGAQQGTLGAGVRAAFSAAVVSNTLIIDHEAAQGAGLWASDSNGFVLRDSFIIDGRTTIDGGGALFSSGTATIERTTFRNNSAGQVGLSGAGGGLALVQVAASVRDCVFENNRAIYGGGVYAEGPAIFERCTIAFNDAFSPTDPTGATRGFGGGVYTKSGPSFIDCTIADNTGVNSGGMANEGTLGSTYLRTRFERNHATGAGGAAAILQRGTLFVGCLFAGNTSGFSSPLMYLRGVPQPASVSFVNCTVVNNGSGAPAMFSSGTVTIFNSIWKNPGDEFAGNIPGVGWSNIEGFSGGLSNINADPQFVNAAAGDYRLSATSPCIDAGRNDQVPVWYERDMAGADRFIDTASVPDTGVGTAPIVDMGAWEFFAPTPTPCVGDADGSRHVTFTDITTVLANFGLSGAAFSAGDADGSGAVNFTDITTVLANFGVSCP